MSSREVALEVSHLTKAFRIHASPAQRIAHLLSGGRLGQPHLQRSLSDVSFQVHAGETFGVMGRNGAGKTTLLNLLARSMLPTEGSIRCPPRVGALIALGAGFDVEATGHENLRQWGQLQADAEFSSDEIAWVADFTELGEALGRPLRTYSAGMLMRLGFAVTTARRPDLLLIDEVMAVGDFFFRRRCHDRIRTFIDEGTAAVLVSHDYTEILQFCTTALVLEEGRVEFIGDAATAVNRYLHPPEAHRHQGRDAVAATAAGAEDADQAAATDPLDRQWPDRSQQVSISGREAWQSEHYRLLALACCDANSSQRWVFSQGETAVICIEIEASADLGVPIATVMLTDDHGLIVHGTSTHMKCTQPGFPLVRGQRWRMRCEITLLLRYGEYQLDCSIGDMSAADYGARAGMTFEEVGARIRQLGRCDRVGIVAVVPRQGGIPAQLTHHGVADLPVAMQCSRQRRAAPAAQGATQREPA